MPQPHHVFSPPTVRVRADPILRIQGYSDPSRVRKPIRYSAARMAERAQRLATPAVAYRRVGIKSLAQADLVLETGQEFHSEAFGLYLRDCASLVAFVLTIGEGLDEESARLAGSDELLDAVMLESAGWLAVESVTKDFSVHLREQARGWGCQLTRRMGPGYSYRKSKNEMVMWGLEEQRTFFEIFEGETLPAHLVEGGCAMLPKMSRSGIYGLRPKNKEGELEDVV